MRSCRTDICCSCCFNFFRKDGFDFMHLKEKKAVSENEVYEKDGPTVVYLKSKMRLKMTLIFAVVAVVALIAVGVLIALLVNQEKEPEITTDVIAERLTEISELATIQLEYRDISHFEDGTVALLTKKSFNVIYDAKIKVGVDLSKVNIEEKGVQVIVTLPYPEIFDVVIDPDTIEFYDEKYALFNWQDRADTVEILKQAEEEVKQRVAERDVFTDAAEQAKLLVENLLSGIAEEKEIIVEVAAAA